MFRPSIHRTIHTVGSENACCIAHVGQLYSAPGAFLGIEVKPENGDLKEAELQISIWMAASLRKKMELARLAFPTSDLLSTPEDAADNATISTDKGLTTLQSSHLLEPTIAIIGNEHKIYYAYPPA